MNILEKIQKYRNKIFERKLISTCVFFILTIYLIGIFAPLLATHDYNSIDLYNTQSSPSKENILGTDKLGRDIFSRVVWGIQTTVIITFTTLLTGTLLLGVSMGLISGYFRGKTDVFIMRLGEIVSSFPEIFLIILLAATIRPRIVEFIYNLEDKLNLSGLANSGIIDYFVVGIALLPLSWFGTMRLIRGQVLIVRELEYIQASQAMGTSNFRIIFFHVLPNVISPVIVSASFGIGAIALSEVVLSFFGIGVQPPKPSLGVMINDVTSRGVTSVSVLRNHPEQLLPPIIIIWILILSWNVVGDYINEKMNPR